MKTRSLSFVKLILLLLAVVVLIRLLPFILRVGQTLLLSTKAFWPAVVPIAIGLWVVYKLRSRARLSGQQKHPLRDVTESIKDSST